LASAGADRVVVAPGVRWDDTGRVGTQTSGPPADALDQARRSMRAARSTADTPGTGANCTGPRRAALDQCGCAYVEARVHAGLPRGAGADRRGRRTTEGGRRWPRD
jgi:hypothetical protein